MKPRALSKYVLDHLRPLTDAEMEVYPRDKSGGLIFAKGDICRGGLIKRWNSQTNRKKISVGKNFCNSHIHLKVCCLWK